MTRLKLKFSHVHIATGFSVFEDPLPSGNIRLSLAHDNTSFCLIRILDVFHEVVYLHGVPLLRIPQWPRDECLNFEIFYSLKKVQVVSEK